MEFDDVRSTDELLCASHVVDSFLLARLEVSVAEGACVVCGVDALAEGVRAINLGDLASTVHEVAIRLYDLEGVWFDNEQQLDPLSTEEVVGALLDESVENLALDLLSALIADLISEPVDWFESIEPSGFDFEWDDFENTVKHVSRQLIAPQGDTPSSPPERAHAFLTSLLIFAEDRAGFVRNLDVGTHLFRSRTDRDHRSLERTIRQNPAAELGPAPFHAASAGRMNAQGIQVFYVGLDEETACAEVSSHSPYDEAVVGEWTLMQPIRVLDLTTVPRPRSVFDDDREAEDFQLSFFADFVERITRPVIIDGNHPVDYAPTQVITEFFRWATEPKLDGILYPSRVREGGINAALFFSEDFWFSQLGRESSSIARHLRLDERATEDPLFVIDPRTVRRVRMERSISVARPQPNVPWAH